MKYNMLYVNYEKQKRKSLEYYYNNKTKVLESATRKKIDSRLEALGWHTEEDSNKCNVFTERAKTVEQNKTFKGKKPDYVLYRSGTNDPIAIIEAKRKGQSLDKALKQAIQCYAKPLGVSIIFVYDSTFIQSFDLRSKKELLIEKKPLHDFISEERLERFIEEGHDIEEVNKKVKHTREQLIKIFQWANNLLRREGLRNLDRFIEFSNILFIKIISEIEDNREKRGLKRRLRKSISFNKIMEISDEDAMLDYVNNVVLKDGLAKEYNRSDDIFQEKLKITNSNTVKKIFKKLSSLELINTESEIKGDAFEYFLKSLSSGNDLGEYFTPRHIIKMMVDIINPQFGNTVIDPFCGTGGFLIEAFRKMKKGQDESDEIIMKTLRELSLFGVELTDTYKIAKMNMIITGDGHNNIVKADTAKKDYWDKFIENSKNKSDKIKVLEKIEKNGFDIIFSNIPYSQRTDSGSNYPIPSNNGDSIFIQEIVLALKDNGRCAVVVPEGFLFRRELKSTRKYLLENCILNAVISLPSGVFLPYTGVKTDVLIFTKKKSTDKVWFFRIDNDGFELNVSRKEIIGMNDIDTLLSLWDSKPNTDKSLSVDIDKIRKGDYSLLMGNYLKAETVKIEYQNPKIILNRIQKFEDEISKEISKLKDMIK